VPDHLVAAAQPHGISRGAERVWLSPQTREDGPEGVVQALTHIPLELDLPTLLRRVHLDPDTEDAEAFAGLVGRAREVARPKALFAEAFIADRGEDTIQIDGITFTSRLLRQNLDQVDRVFPFVATCGRELDTVELPPGDVLAAYWWDTIKAAVLGAARAHLHAHLAQRFRLGKTATMSPGSGDVDTWPIEQQQELFALLGGVRPHIGVELTDSCLMIPNKTVSGMLFPTEKDFRTCQVCHREICPNRSAPFDEALWRSLQQPSFRP
jgi:hypothetical protein